jgi:hypothetical protein
MAIRRRRSISSSAASRTPAATPRAQPRDRADLYNLKLYKGGEANQWVVWDNTAGTYVERPTDGEGRHPAWFHRANQHFSSTRSTASPRS